MTDPSHAEQQLRIEASLTHLNERIARLSGALGAELHTSADLDRILDRDNAHLRPADAMALSDSERRLHHEWEELRGLLVLRCELMSHTLNAIGYDATRALTQRVEDGLARAGFAPGADGFDLRRRMRQDDPTA